MLITLKGEGRKNSVLRLIKYESYLKALEERDVYTEGEDKSAFIYFTGPSIKSIEFSIQNCPSQSSERNVSTTSSKIGLDNLTIKDCKHIAGSILFY